MIQQDFQLIGKRKIIIGVVNIKNDKYKKNYRFYAPLKNDTVYEIALSDMNDMELFPKLWYHLRDKSFTFEGQKEFAIKSSNNIDIIISGVLIWAKNKKD